MGTRHAHATGNAEQYTPAEIVDKVRRVYKGVIHCDPASSELANLTVGALSYYTASENGMQKFWKGPNIFINPPYSRGQIQHWASTAVWHHKTYGHNIIWLSNNNTETEAIQLILAAASVVHIPKGRIKFYNPKREQKSPLQGQLIALLSWHQDVRDRFSSVFKDGVNLYEKT